MITKKNGRAADTGATKKNNAPDKRTDGSAINARVERWRGHIAKRLAICDANGVDIPARWLEEIERRPMADVITEWVCRERGIDVTNRNPDQQYNLELDEDYERAATRTRNNHEREVAIMAVMAHVGVMLHHAMPIDDTMHALIRNFYHAGDCGIYAAVVRAVKSALAWERDADANATQGKAVKA